MDYEPYFYYLDITAQNIVIELIDYLDIAQNNAGNLRN
jgi:hypothetical protein